MTMKMIVSMISGHNTSIETYVNAYNTQ